jgi:Ca-activated chloride channel family protein
MNWIGNFHFIRPEWLFALIPAVVIAVLLFRRYQQSTAWADTIDPTLMPFLLIQPPKKPSVNPLPILLLGWVLAILAVAGPTTQKIPQPILEREDALVIILDLTWSMYASDVSPSRLTNAKRKITDLLMARNEGMTGLIVFAGDAHAVSPLTDDNKTILSLLSTLGPEIMPAPGSALAPALTLARSLFVSAGAATGRVLVITDEVRDAQAALSAARALSKQYPLSLMIVGTQSGAPIRLPQSMGDNFLKDDQGSLVIPAVNFDAITRFADASGASVSELNLLNDDLAVWLEPPNRLEESFRIVERDFDLWEELGPYLILILLPLAIVGFRRGWLWGLAVVILMPVDQAGAADFWTDLWQTPDQQGASALELDAPASAAALFEDPAWRATAHYRNQDFKAAAEDFAASGGIENHYNRGNALARAGDLNGALAAFDQVLSSDPEHEDAAFNKALIERLLDQQSQEQAASDQDENSEQKPQEGGQGEQEQDASEQDPSQDAQNQQEGDTEDDAQDSEAAREQPESDQSQEEAAETSEQAVQEADEALDPEEAQALEQWLKRVPDDPGGLLRRKFEQQFEERVRQGEITRQDFERNW